jgi:hypothetical protein
MKQGKRPSLKNPHGDSIQAIHILGRICHTHLNIVT